MKKKGKEEEEVVEIIIEEEEKGERGGGEEDWCFECYEGGLLLVCDYKDCLKSYHADCVSDKSVLNNDDPWFCRRHSCYQCKRSSTYQCFGCPNALCKRCTGTFKFARIRGNKGLCHNCLKLALLGEKGLNVDSDGELVDFEDMETNEGLFLDYWKKVVKVKEGLTLEDLLFADAQINKGRKHKAGYKLKHSDDEEEHQSKANLHDEDDDDHNVDDVEELSPKLGHKRKKSDKQKFVMLHRSKSRNVVPKSKQEIVSWASNGLIDFLASVGENTSRKHQPYEIASIINRYAEENKLLNPEKPRKIVCDVKLKGLFGKKMVEKNKLVDLLELHFPENIESSEGEIEETKYSPAKMEKKSTVSCKKQRSSIKDKICEEYKESEWVPQWHFALIVSENIKLVYLKKSLVLELFMEPETFSRKIIGSFVRVKLGQGSGSKRYSLQLLPVTGINITSKEKNHPEFHLQVSTLTKDISINVLSDDNFTEEECEELKKKVNDGLIPRTTIVELEQKAKLLHDDITKHWIVKELATLQNIIDRANEKGWRRDFYVYSERRRLLQTSEEQSRLLRKVPNVIPDMAEDGPIAIDDIMETVKGEQLSGKSMLLQSPESPGSYGENDVTCSEEKEETKLDHTIKLDEEKIVTVNQMNEMLQEKKNVGIVSCYEGNYDPCTDTCFLEVLSQPQHVAPQVEDNILFECELSQNFQK